MEDLDHVSSEILYTYLNLNTLKGNKQTDSGRPESGRSLNIVTNTNGMKEKE